MVRFTFLSVHRNQSIINHYYLFVDNVIGDGHFAGLISFSLDSSVILNSTSRNRMLCWSSISGIFAPKQCFSLFFRFLTSMFELNYGYSHKYTRRVRRSKKYNSDFHRALFLTFLGPQCKRYWMHVVLVLISTADFICMAVIRIAPFSYYVPVLPFLIIVRNDHVQLFGLCLHSMPSC